MMLAIASTRCSNEVEILNHRMFRISFPNFLKFLSNSERIYKYVDYN